MPKSKLLSDLADLGGSLAEEYLPDPAAVRQIVGALVHYIDTGGSLEPPVAAEPSPAEGEQASEAEQKATRLEAELAAARGEHPAEPVETPEQKSVRLEGELAAARGGGA